MDARGRAAPAWNAHALLNIDNNPTHQCIGESQGGARCSLRITADNHASATAQLDTLAQRARSMLTAADEEELRTQLGEIASALLCIKWHQGQGPELAKRWYGIIEERLRQDTAVRTQEGRLRAQGQTGGRGKAKTRATLRDRNNNESSETGGAAALSLLQDAAREVEPRQADRAPATPATTMQPDRDTGSRGRNVRKRSMAELDAAADADEDEDDEHHHKRARTAAWVDSQQISRGRTAAPGQGARRLTAGRGNQAEAAAMPGAFPNSPESEAQENDDDWQTAQTTIARDARQTRKAVRHSTRKTKSKKEVKLPEPEPEPVKEATPAPPEPPKEEPDLCPLCLDEVPFAKDNKDGGVFECPWCSKCMHWECFHENREDQQKKEKNLSCLMCFKELGRWD